MAGYALKAIVARHSDGVLLNDGSLDRAALRELVFADPDERRWLEGLINPLIGRHLNQALNDARSPYAILVNPVLIETGHYRVCSRVLVVDVPEAVQIERTMIRDQNSEDQVKAILNAQADREDRLAKAQDVIVNDGSLADLDAQVHALHEKYLQLAQSAST
ncbi:MAG: dephospho-CoA kinase [Proteobacteria bacterium]|nr:dephospho-CoA kinase [Pseudomonadota bacterium]